MGNMRKKATFRSVFFKNEYKALAGNNHATIGRLVFLLTVTLIAVGFSVGGLNRLRTKMNNPFTNWVDLEVSSRGSEFLSDVKRFFSDPDTLKAYQLDHTDGWNTLSFQFYTREFNYFKQSLDTLKYIRYGRTINMEDSLFYAILNPESGNVVYKNKDAFDESGRLSYSCGLIITEALAIKLGYPEYHELKRVKYCTPDNKILFQELIAVVKQLPNQAQFVCSPTVFAVGDRTNSTRCNAMFKEDKDTEFNQFEVLSTSKEESAFIESGIHQIYQTDRKYYSINGPNAVPLDTNITYYTYQINFLDEAHSTLPKKAALKQYLFQSGRFKPYFEIDCGEDCADITNPHYMSFNFNNLANIRRFKAMMSDRFGVEVPMHQVESKENFHDVTTLTSVLSFVLMALSIISILLYLGNLVFNHIEGVKSNLGTFKAFGLTDAFLRKLYISIVCYMLLISWLIAFPTAYFLGKILDAKAINIGFEIINLQIAGMLALVFLFSACITYWVLKQKLGATPGDLIYER